ncbi:hypothetical protein LTR08_005935 [Meristemomyces frigidus]|nr:hypothetical protein LTR08_005935 [Meristemomyces frigidus]
MHQLAIVDWTDLLEILVSIARVARPTPNAVGWEAGALSSMLQPEATLDALYAHIASADIDDPLYPRHEVQLRWFKSFCENIKKHILYGRDNGTGSGRNSDSQYGVVYSPPNDGRQPKPGSLPYSSELPMPRVTDIAAFANIYDTSDKLNNGVLDKGFWTNFPDS